MRELTIDEVMMVSGGKSDKEIVVIGNPGGFGAGDTFTNPTSPGNSSDPSTGGGTGVGSGVAGSGYSTSGATAEANAFADAHVKNQGITAADQKDYRIAHDDFAKFYDYAKGHGNDAFNIGNGKTMTYSVALDAISKVSYVITSAEALSGATGARTTVNSDGSGLTIYMNPENSNQAAYDNNFTNNSGEDYVIFHELGHALNYYAPGGLFAGSNTVAIEAAANTAGRSMEMALGLQLLQANGRLAAPNNGYN